jgi:hypothetical protein
MPFVAPPPPQTRLLRRAAELRAAAEKAGTSVHLTLDGATVEVGVPTERDKRTSLKVALDFYTSGAQVEPVPYSVGDISYLLSAAEFASVVQAAADHVHLCFQAQADAQAAVRSGAATTYAEVEAIFNASMTP